MEEASLIPYEATDLSAGRILVLAAHPDDEILGPGGTLAVNAGMAEAIRIWVATDGVRQGGTEPDEDHRKKRRGEPPQAAETLGLEPRVFGALPDRDLALRSGELASEIGGLIAEFRPDLIFCPSPVEIHPDHRALAEAVYEKLASSRPADADHDRFRFLRIAFYEISHPLLPNVLVDIAGVAKRKEEALAAYVSQQAVRDYAGAVGGLNAYRRAPAQGGRAGCARPPPLLGRRSDPQPPRARPGSAREPARADGAPVAGPARQRRRRVRRGSARRVCRRLRGDPRGASRPGWGLERGQSGRVARRPGAGGLPGRRRPLLSRPRGAPDAGAPERARARRLFRCRHRRVRAAGRVVGTAPPHASILARLRSRPAAPRQLHPAAHAAPAARPLHCGGGIRRDAGVFRGMGLPDSALLRDLFPPRARGDLRVPGLRRRKRRSSPRPRRRVGVPEDAGRDLPAVRGSAHRGGAGPGSRSASRSDLVLIRTRRDFSGGAAIPARESPPLEPDGGPNGSRAGGRPVGGRQGKSRGRAA